MSYPQYTQDPPSVPDQPSPSGEQSATDRATEAAQQGKQAVSDVAQTAASRAGDVKDEAVRQARDLVGETRSQVTEQAGRQHQALVSNLRSLSDELARMSRTGGESGVATELAGQAQQRVATLADWLGSREPGQILDEARNFARRRPGTFLVGALAAGVVVGRLARGAVDVHTGDSGPDAQRADSPAGIEPVGEQPIQPTYSPPSYSGSEQPYPAAPGYSVPSQSAPAYPTPPTEQTQAYPNSESWR